MLLKIISAIFLLFSLTSCHSNYKNNQFTGKLNNPLFGKVIDDRYYDAKGWYSISLPQNCAIKISENQTPNSSCASFTDEVGSQMRFEVYNMNYQVPLTNNEIEVKLRMIFEEFITKITSIICPNTKITHIEFMKNEQQLFAILDVPGGSTFVNSKTNKRLDTTIGFLLFFAENKLIIISNQFSPPDTDIQKSTFGIDFPSDNFLKELLSFKKAYRSEEVKPLN